MADSEPTPGGDKDKGKGRRSMWNSGRAWALVLGGMIVIGATNLYLAFRSMPDDFDENWRYADAGVEEAPDAAAPASPSPR